MPDQTPPKPLSGDVLTADEADRIADTFATDRMTLRAQEYRTLAHMLREVARLTALEGRRDVLDAESSRAFAEAILNPRAPTEDLVRIFREAHKRKAADEPAPVVPAGGGEAAEEEMLADVQLERDTAFGWLQLWQSWARDIMRASGACPSLTLPDDSAAREHIGKWYRASYTTTGTRVAPDYAGLPVENVDRALGETRDRADRRDLEVINETSEVVVRYRANAEDDLGTLAERVERVIKQARADLAQAQRERDEARADFARWQVEIAHPEQPLSVRVRAAALTVCALAQSANLDGGNSRLAVAIDLLADVLSETATRHNLPPPAPAPVERPVRKWRRLAAKPGDDGPVYTLRDDDCDAVPGVVAWVDFFANRPAGWLAFGGNARRDNFAAALADAEELLGVRGDRSAVEGVGEAKGGG